MSSELRNMLEVFIHLGGASFLVSAVWRVVSFVNEMKTSIQQLNQNIAVIIERVEGHEKRLENLEDRNDRHDHRR